MCGFLLHTIKYSQFKPYLCPVCKKTVQLIYLV